jgi:hypothetical protein
MGVVLQENRFKSTEKSCFLTAAAFGNIAFKQIGHIVP